jgi:hypothetical protein
MIISTDGRADSVGVSCFACSALSDTQCGELLKVFDGIKEPRLAVLWRTFAPPSQDKCVKRFLWRFRDKPHTLAIHFQNGPGRRNRRLSGYELLPRQSVEEQNKALERRDRNTLRTITREAARIVAWVEERATASTSIELSTGLEDNYTNKAFRVLVHALKKTVPETWELYRNPVGENEEPFTYFGASFIELHGYRPRWKRNTTKQGRCSYSNDGIDIDLGSNRPIEPYVFLPEMRSFIRRARSNNCRTWIWWGAVQGLKGGRGFTNTRGRDLRVFPSDITELNIFLRSLEK